ncbi:DUF3761 domain-containing protein [Amycolatopsis taiwanensis]|uniref:DUF3761 domain-containing protein n=1 Tax=Amycolatopsis taiwanensis TaxID=342230 RepID=UPI000A004E22|nr:DUF3761 domain-containing protein [Amycolatopsis taiwanensis]
MPRNPDRSNTRRRALSRAASVLGGLVLGAGALAGCQTGNPAPGTSSTLSLSAIPSSSTPSVAQTTTEAAVPSAPASTPQASATTPQAPPAPPKQSPAVAAAPKPSSSAHSASCPAGTYQNVDGVCVKRPVQAPAPPAGATAKCKDGTYSFSQHRSGTCSGHGGVAQWL